MKPEIIDEIEYDNAISFIILPFIIVVVTNTPKTANAIKIIFTYFSLKFCCPKK